MTNDTVLLSWVARNNDPFERFDRQGNPIEPVFGPTLTLLFDEESCHRGKVRDVILFARRSRGREEGKGEDEPAAAASADEIHKASGGTIRCEVITWEHSDPTDHRALFEFLRRTLPALRSRFRGRELIIHVSPGTPAMHTIGSGSAFHFTARLQPAAQSETLGIVPFRNIEDLSVLVVDDNATNRRVLEEILRRWGMRPELAEGGASALDLLRRAAELRKPFPLVLTDAHMPEIDGFMLAQKIQRDPELAGVTILMLSSGAQSGEIARCRQLGVTTYLTKPVRQSELRQAICIALGHTASVISVTNAPETDPLPSVASCTVPRF